MSSQAEFDKAWADTQEILCADPARLADPTLPIYRLHANEKLDAQRSLFESGDKMALLAAIRICANYDLVLPEWVAYAFIHAYDQVLNCRMGSWDDAFGTPYKKGKHLNRMRQAREKRLNVWQEYQMARAQGRSINREFFEEIGCKLGLGKTRAEELLAQARTLFPDNEQKAKNPDPAKF